MRIIIANYRYFIAGGPEKYMFKFMDAAEKMGIEVIPFSVKNPQNEKIIKKGFIICRAYALFTVFWSRKLNISAIFRAISRR